MLKRDDVIRTLLHLTLISNFYDTRGLVLILIELSLIQKLLIQISKVCHIKVASLTILLEWQAVLSIYITMSEYFREKSHPIS